MNFIPPAADILRAVRAQKSFVDGIFDELRTGSSRGLGIWRDTYGPGEQFGYRVIEDRARKLGLEQRRDAASNLYMTLPGADRSLPAVMTGSHLDSVANGGNFDGAAGVVAGLAAAAAMKVLGIAPKRDLTTMAIRAEESVWFEVSYIGSRSAFGVLPDGALEAKRVDTGRTLADHMAECGADVDAVRRREAHLRRDRIKSWVEVHIEQAPSLVEAGKPVGIGTGVPGNFRYPNARIIGEYAHVGLPRRFRHDAALAAADFAVGMDEIWQRNDSAGRPMAFTIGRFHTDPAEHALTKVAGEFFFSLDVRAYDKSHIAELEGETKALISRIENKRGVRFELGTRASADPAPSDQRLLSGLTSGAEVLGLATMPLGSPASHDTATFGVAGIPTAMLFVRNANGSHNPHEAMETDDFLDAAAILTNWLIRETSE